MATEELERPNDPECLDCKRPMLESAMQTHFYCPKCGKQYHKEMGTPVPEEPPTEGAND